MGRQRRGIIKRNRGPPFTKTLDLMSDMDRERLESSWATTSKHLSRARAFTKFNCEESASTAPEQQIGLDALINMPGVPNGMGAVLFCKGGKPECLEVYTYGDDHWDGVYDGFSIERTA